MKLVVIAAAKLDEREASAWYATREAGLPKRFRSELKTLLRRVGASPRQFPVVMDDHRQALLGVFPYAVIFEIIDNVVVVQAIAHLSRFPGYWADR